MEKDKGKRKITPKTDERKWRDTYRAACPRHVVEFETDLDVDGCRHTAAMADDLRQAGNEMTGTLKKNYEQLVRTKAYRALKKQYGDLSERMSCLDKESSAYRRLKKEQKQVGDAMTEMQKTYHVTWDDLRIMSGEMAVAYHINSVFTLSRAEDIWHGMERVLYHGANTIHFKKRGDLPVIRAKQSDKAITLKYDKDRDQLVFYTDQLGKFGVKIPRKYRFLQDEYAALVDYLRDPG